MAADKALSSSYQGGGAIVTEGAVQICTDVLNIMQELGARATDVCKIDVGSEGHRSGEISSKVLSVVMRAGMMFPEGYPAEESAALIWEKVARSFMKVDPDFNISGPAYEVIINTPPYSPIRLAMRSVKEDALKKATPRG